MGSFTGGVLWAAGLTQGVWIPVSLDHRDPLCLISLDLNQPLSSGYINTYGRHIIGYTFDIQGFNDCKNSFQLLAQTFLRHLIYTRPWGFRDESPCPQ